MPKWPLGTPVGRVRAMPRSCRTAPGASRPHLAWKRFRSRAYASGFTNSGVATAVYNIQSATPSITSLNPTSGPVGTAVTITGSNFGPSQGIGTVTFNGASSGTAATWSPGIITVNVPSGATTGNVVVTVGGVPSNGQSFTVGTAPIITSLSPTSGPAGTSVTITGSNFGSYFPAPTVTFNGTAVTTVFWSPTTLWVTVPSGATTGNVVVTVGGVASNELSFTVTSPAITSVSPTSGPAGTLVTISGAAFGSAQGTGSVWLGSGYAPVVSWTNTQVVVTVPSIATSGPVRVQQGGIWSNTLPFLVNIATISNVSPASGVAGTQVTITGSGFGSVQGNGQVWLGTAYGLVQSWSDTQIVAVVASGTTFSSAQAQQQSLAARARAERKTRLGALSGRVERRSDAQVAPRDAGGSGSGAQVLQHGVWSQPAPFSVNILQITDVSPALAGPGTAVTITGTGFGASQGSGSVWLGSMAGLAYSWSDTQVVAAVATGSLTGIVRIQQGGAWSNALTLTLPGNTTILVPNLLNMVVGDTATIQDSSLSGQPLTGLTWTSSDPTVVSLSTDDPPVLTALAPGHVTIIGGTASVDVTVSAGTLPQGTVLWSNPGNGSGVGLIVPAVPSPSGVADVFAFQGDGTVQAITSDGKTAWTADVSLAYLWWWGNVVPDFQGGLVALESRGGQYLDTIVKLDGITGQPAASYSPSGTSELKGDMVVHPDGTIFATQHYYDESGGGGDFDSVVGIDPTTGGLKFGVTIPFPSSGADGTSNAGTCRGGRMIIAGDGYAYLPFGWMSDPGPGTMLYHLRVLRIDSSGASNVIQIQDWVGGFSEICGLTPDIITNADTGTLITWNYYPAQASAGMAITTGASASLINMPGLPGGGPIEPVLQAQDGSFIGLGGDSTQNYMIAFDTSGNFRWSVAGDYQPEIATADGGVIAYGSGAVITFDQNGNATGQTAAFNEPGWLGNVLSTAYPAGTGAVSLVTAPSISYASTFAAFQGGNASGQGTAIEQVLTRTPPPDSQGGTASDQIDAVPQVSASRAVNVTKQLPNLSLPLVCYPLPVTLFPGVQPGQIYIPTCGNINAIELLTNGIS